MPEQKYNPHHQLGPDRSHLRWRRAHWRYRGGLLFDLVGALFWLAILSLAVLNYYYVVKRGASFQRLRWHLVARQAMVTNQCVRDGDFRPTLSWLPTTEWDILPAGSNIDGHYLTRDLKEGDCLHRDFIQPIPICPSPADTKLVPIRVRADTAPMLKPRLLISLLPSDDTPVPEYPNQIGPFTILEVMPASGDTAIVVVSPTHNDQVLPSDLTSRSWVPILEPPTSQPSAGTAPTGSNGKT